MSAPVAQPIPSSNQFTQGLTVVSTAISDTKGFLQVSEFAIATITMIGKIFAELPISAVEFAKQLKTGVQVLACFNLINDLKWWFCDKRQSWQHTAHKATMIVLEILNTAIFLETIKVFKLSEIAGKIGSVPVIGLAASVLTGATTIFSLWHYGKKISVLNKKISQIKSSLLTNQGDPTLKALLSATRLEKTKAKISLVSDISTLALSILGLVGLCTSVTVLAMNSWLMIVLGLVVAGIGLYDVLYSKAHPAPA